MANILKLGGAIGLGRLAAAPANPENGWMYYDTTLNKLQQYVNGGWEDVAAGEVTPEFSTDDFRLQNGGDPSKQTAFNNDEVSPGETRTIRVPDRDLYLDNYLPTGNVRAASIGNIALLEGEQTIDGVALGDGDTVMLKDQDDRTEDGIYFVRTGPWERMDRTKLGDVIQVDDGQANRNTFWYAKYPFPSANYGVDEIYFDLVNLDPYKVTSGIGANVVSDQNIPDREGLLTIDGYTLNDGDIVLLARQDDETENGLYQAHSGAWDRVQEMMVGKILTVFGEGTKYANSYWRVGSNSPVNPVIRIGVDQIYLNPVSFDVDKITGRFGARVVSYDNETLSGLPTIDGRTLDDGDTVLLAGQNDQVENGMWEVRAGAWDRIKDYHAGSIVFIFDGDDHNNESFIIDAQTQNSRMIAFGEAEIYPNKLNNNPNRTQQRIDDIEDELDNNVMKLDGSSEMQGFLNMGNNRINFLADPVDGDEAATKQYVDNIVQNPYPNMTVATTGPITLSGVQIVDGVTTDDETDVIVKDQADPTENGLYRSDSVGAWTRLFEAQLKPGNIVRAAIGDTNAGTSYQVLAFNFPIAYGTDEITFVTVSANVDLSDVLKRDGSVSMLNGAQLSARNADDDGDIQVARVTGNSVFFGGSASLAAELSSAGNVTLLSGGTILLNSADSVISAVNSAITNVLDPVNPQDAATKAYVDAQIAGIPDPLVYMGTWNASTNTPTLSNAGAAAANGHLYQVNVAGSVDFGAGSISFEVGDKVVSNGTVWEKWDMTDAVASVNGQTGIVELDSDDIDEGSTNLYFTDLRAQSATISQVITNGVTDKAPSEDAVFDALALKLSNVVEDTTPQLGGNLDVQANAIESSTSEVVLAGQNAVRRAKAASKADFIEEEYIHAIALAASQTNTIIAAFTVAHATVEGLEIEYKVKEATSNDVRIGRLRVVTNGTDIAFFDDAVETNDTGVTFDAVINGANINVRYSSGSNTATMRADVKKIKA